MRFSSLIVGGQNLEGDAKKTHFPENEHGNGNVEITQLKFGNSSSILDFGFFSREKFSGVQHKCESTPLKTNMSPENQWLEDVFAT